MRWLLAVLLITFVHVFDLRYLLEREFPFAAVSHWYEKTFGSPVSFFPPNEEIPVIGNVQGSVVANVSGVIIKVGEKSVHLQQPDGTIARYEAIHPTVLPYEKVKKGQILGIRL